ncbi:sensor histidine kinase [Paenibacillus sp. FSL H7-0331]|uniref:ATP-binding protein n=1 Tax=Paenibacillus sp. FSL H7-0331 TaxID=1920421 RepID=UPI00096D8013|nr:sensor histidine kinase [Paenibacillus sp. FSL H7-0331]OMF19040.1 histidine kinase [Paenibacillus sp. FSL H7-0331]
MLQRLKINWKIAFLSFGIVVFSLLIGGTILVGSIISLKEDELGRRLLVTARTVAQMPEVAGSLSTPQQKDTSMQAAAERIRIINDVTYIVVMDMNRMRLTHPVESNIGTYSRGTDEGPAFAEHTYIARAKGELGTALRAFVPVMNADEHTQVGVVLVGQLLPSVGQVLLELSGQAYLILLISLVFGIWGSWLLAQHIKKQMFELEPHEIAQLLTERTATFHAMHEGVIAIDKHERITICNDPAKQMLNIQGEVIGRMIREVVPDTRLPEILVLNQPIYNKELQIGHAVIMSNRVPITVKGQTVGAVAIFRDRTEVAQMAEELTGVRTFVDALRVQNHEYMNKLHTIGGLIQLGSTDRALDYIFEITEQQVELTQYLTQRIKNDSLTGLLLGKISRGKELGITLEIDRQSHLEHLPERIDDHDFVILIGNLVENAFDALGGIRADKRIFLSIEQDEEVLSILVEDNGCGIDSAIQEKIFEQGFTTKGSGGRGIGLYLIASIVRKGDGSIVVDSKPAEGTSIFISFPMRLSQETTVPGVN